MFDDLGTIEILALFIFWVGVFGGVGAAIGSSRGQAAAGFLLGSLLGVIGWIIVLLLPREGKRCAECRGVLEQGARRCCHCGAEVAVFTRGASLPPQRSSDAAWYVSRQGKTEGPFTTVQLRALFDSGAVSAVDQAAREGDPEWIAVGSVLGL